MGGMGQLTPEGPGRGKQEKPPPPLVSPSLSREGSPPARADRKTPRAEERGEGACRTSPHSTDTPRPRTSGNRRGPGSGRDRTDVAPGPATGEGTTRGPPRGRGTPGRNPPGTPLTHPTNRGKAVGPEGRLTTPRPPPAREGLAAPVPRDPGPGQAARSLPEERAHMGRGGPGKGPQCAPRRQHPPGGPTDPPGA